MTIVANPAANPWPWHERWPPPGLPSATPAESREAQWQREGLPASLAEWQFARWGVTAQLVGQLLDLHFDGRSEILERDGDSVRRLARAERADRGCHVCATVDA